MESDAEKARIDAKEMEERHIVTLNAVRSRLEALRQYWLTCDTADDVRQRILSELDRLLGMNSLIRDVAEERLRTLSYRQGTVGTITTRT